MMVQKSSIRCCIFVVAAIGASDQATAAAIQSKEIADSIGVATHVEYSDSGYRQIGQVREALQYLLITHIRDAAPNPNYPDQSSYSYLGQLGFKFDLVSPKTLFFVDLLESQAPGSVAALEGVNEINNNKGFTFAGHTGTEAAQAYQLWLFSAVKADPKLKDVPTYSFTDWPNHPGLADYANMHPYPKHGEAPSATLLSEIKAQQLNMPGKPIVCTEFGYFTAAPDVGWGGVTEAQQARFLLMGLLDNAAAGVKRTYIYQLLDAYPDPGGRDQEKHFGLFDINYRPKLAATAIHNMMRILKAAPATTADGHAAPPVVTTSASSLVLQEAPGAYAVFVWGTATSRVEVSFGGGHRAIDEFVPVLSDSALQHFTDEDQVKIGLTDGPVFLRLK